jgi:hypothetical protein
MGPVSETGSGPPSDSYLVSPLTRRWRREKEAHSGNQFPARWNFVQKITWNEGRSLVVRKVSQEGEMVEFLAHMPTDTMIFLTMAVLGLATMLIVLKRLI